MAKQAKVWTGSAWADLASATTDLTPYSTTAQMNTAITAGVGLVPILTQTIGSAVSSVVVNNAFSATYDAYKIIISGGVGSLAGWGYLQLGASTANYSFGAWEKRYSGSTTDYQASTASTNFSRCWSQLTNVLDLNIEIKNPNLAKYTVINYSFQSGNDGNYNGGGQHKVATAYTDFTIGVESGTISGGTLKVYGYKN
jgi:hypothetical protein